MVSGFVCTRKYWQYREYRQIWKRDSEFHMQKVIYRSLIFISLYLASCVFVSGQGCPVIEIVTPSASPIPGEAFVVNAVVKGSLGTGFLKYEWTTSSGLIEAGQNSAEISIRTSLEDAGRNLDIKLTVFGVSSVCNNKALEVIGVAALPIVCGLGQEFGALNSNEVKANVDNVYVQLDNNPNTVVLFEMIFTESETRQQKKLRITRILDAIRFRKYDLNKAIFLISKEKDFTNTRVRILTLSADMSGLLKEGTLINGQDMKSQLPTLFQNK